jgi:predicted ester cyclase
VLHHEVDEPVIGPLGIAEIKLRVGRALLPEMMRDPCRRIGPLWRIAGFTPGLDSRARTGVWYGRLERNASLRSPADAGDPQRYEEAFQMSKLETNKAIVGRWFTEFWGKDVDLSVIDDIAAPDMLLKYSLHAPRRGRADIKAFMADFRKAFPDLNFWGTVDLIAEGDYVVGQWEGGGTHTGPAFSDFLVGGLPASTGRKMHFTGTTVLKVVDGKIVEEIGLDDGVTALTQLGLLKKAA